MSDPAVFSVNLTLGGARTRRGMPRRVVVPVSIRDRDLPMTRCLRKAFHQQVALDQGDDEVRYAPTRVLKEPKSIARGPSELCL